MMKQDRKRKWAVFAILFPALLLSVFSFVPYVYAAENDNSVISLGTPYFWQDNVVGDNKSYSVFAYNGANGNISKYPSYYLDSFGVYYNNAPYIDVNSVSSYGFSWQTPLSSADMSVTLTNIDRNKPNTQFYYKMPSDSNISTYLVVTRFLYDSIKVPDYDCVFSVQWNFDYFWNDDRDGAEPLKPYLQDCVKPILRFHNGGSGTIYNADPSTIVITNTASRSWGLIAYFNLSMDQLRSITGGAEFDYMQVVIPYPAMLPGSGNSIKSRKISCYTSFPTYYSLIDSREYAKELANIQGSLTDIQTSIDGLTTILQVSTPADDEKVEDMQEQRSAYDEALSDYERNANWVEVGAGNLINMQLDPNLVPEEAQDFISVIGVFANNPWLAPLIMAGLSFMLIRVIMIGVG